MVRTPGNTCALTRYYPNTSRTLANPTSHPITGSRRLTSHYGAPGDDCATPEHRVAIARGPGSFARRDHRRAARAEVTDHGFRHRGSGHDFPASGDPWAVGCNFGVGLAIPRGARACVSGRARGLDFGLPSRARRAALRGPTAPRAEVNALGSARPLRRRDVWGRVHPRAEVRDLGYLRRGLRDSFAALVRRDAGRGDCGPAPRDVWRGFVCVAGLRGPRGRVRGPRTVFARGANLGPPLCASPRGRRRVAAPPAGARGRHPRCRASCKRTGVRRSVVAATALPPRGPGRVGGQTAGMGAPRPAPFADARLQLRELQPEPLDSGDDGLALGGRERAATCAGVERRMGARTSFGPPSGDRAGVRACVYHPVRVSCVTRLPPRERTHLLAFAHVSRRVC